jgi:multiple sugar transport system substrate-binding protein
MKIERKKDQEYILQQQLKGQLQRGQITRRSFMTRMLAGSLSLAGFSVLTDMASPGIASAQDRPFTPTAYNWIDDLHGGSIKAINERIGNVNFQIAPVEGFGIQRFVAEARNEESTWDIYIGTTPFVELRALVESDSVEPWTPYISQDVIDDFIPAIYEESKIDGVQYAWPFLLDVISMGWHTGIVEAAGLDPDVPPETWTEYLANAKQIVESGAAPFGATFDANGWRSLAPFAHSESTDVYDEEGRFLFTSEPALKALELMKNIMEYSHPDILLQGQSDAGVNQTPDEIAFGAERVGYITKYQNAPTRFAENWRDPSLLKLGALPKFEGGEGSTVFWTTGAALFKYGQNKEAAAAYMTELTYDMQLWQNSIEGTETGRPMQLPPYSSIYAEWDANPPEWLPPGVSLIRGQLDVAKAIPNHLFGLQQFIIGRPEWEKYLMGEESDPMVALQAAWDAVTAEIERT